MYLEKLKKIRKEKGFTQESLARKANISFHTLVRIENGGIQNPTIGTVIKLSKALGIDLEKLIKM